MRRRWVRVAVAAAGLGLAWFVLRGTLPHPGDIWQALRTAAPGWLALAAAAQFASMSMFGQQQRRLLAAFGVSVPVGAAIALAYSRSAISITMPAGAAVSSSFALRQFRLWGASAGAAAAVIIATGLQSIAALVIIYGAWLVLAGSGSPQHLGIVLATGAAAGLGAAWLWVRSRHRRVRDGASPARPGRDVRDLPARRGGWLAAVGIRRRARPPGFAAAARPRWLRALVDTITTSLRSTASLSPDDWLSGIGYAAANWWADIACLVLVARTLDLGVGTVAIVGAYLAVQVVRQVPLTPGGIGIVEASLLVALVTAGATSGRAAAAVLVYRLLSCWLVAPVGLAAWFVLRGGKAAASTAPDSPPEPSSSPEPSPAGPHIRLWTVPRAPVAHGRADPTRRAWRGPRNRRRDPAP